MDGRLFVGDMSILLTLATLSLSSLLIAIHTSPIHPAYPTNPTNRRPRRQSVIDDHIIQSPYTSHPEIPTYKERLESRRSDESGFSCPVPF